jgi:hypothetical protein
MTTLLLLQSQKPNTMIRCPCGITFDSHDPAGSYVRRQHWRSLNLVIMARAACPICLNLVGVAVTYL